MPGSQGFYVPEWSPDGKYMVAMAQNPSRMMLYSTQSATWKELKKFELPWGYYVWSSDSKSLYMAVVGAEPGLYRLAIVDGKWERLGKLDGLNYYSDELEGGFLSLSPDGQPAIMSDTSVVQIYSAKWTNGPDLH
jgi:hypothetical protein